MAYLIKHLKYTCDNALKYIKSKREIIGPSDSFVNQLKLFEASLAVNNI